MEAIGVITVTRGRPHLLRRAIQSVRAQDYDGPVGHLVVVDDDMAVYEPIRQLVEQDRSDPPRRLRWAFKERAPTERSGPGRLAKLRNWAAATTATRVLAFLDDDNEFEPHHLSSLMACMVQTGCPAVHSFRYLLLPDGTPYLERRMPWKRDPDDGRAVYEDLQRKHVFVHDSNVVRDRADPRWVDDPVRMVDTSEWLFDRDLLLRIPFCEEYSYQDWLDVIPEDNKLLQALIQYDVPIACTHMPTLRYYLGGYSNAFPSSPLEPAPDLSWCAP